MKLLRFRDVLCGFMISSSNSSSTSVYVYVFSLVLFPSSHLGQGELMNLVILIRAYLCLWSLNVGFCFFFFLFFGAPRWNLNPSLNVFWSSIVRHNSLAIGQKFWLRKDLELIVIILGNLCQIHLPIVELAFWKPRKLFSKLSTWALNGVIYS